MLKALLKVNWKIINDLKYVFHISICTVSKIIAIIDYKGQNWTFLTLEVIFKVTHHH